MNTSIYKNFENRIGFSIGSRNKEDKLEQYHPPAKKESLNHKTVNVISHDPCNNYHVRTLIPNFAAETAWNTGGDQIFQELRLKAYPEDIDGDTPVNRLIHSGGIRPFNGFILDAYKLERKIITKDEDPIIKELEISNSFKGEIFIDTMTWIRVKNNNDNDFDELKEKLLNKNKIIRKLEKSSPFCKNLKIDIMGIRSFNILEEGDKSFYVEKVYNPRRLINMDLLNNEVDDYIYEGKRYEIIDQFETKWIWVPYCPEKPCDTRYCKDPRCDS